jgi:hypothetical protein
MGKKSAKRIVDDLADEFDHPLQRINGYDDCVIGTCYAYGRASALLYDYEKMIAKLMKDMSREDAVEFFEFNISGAFTGPGLPAFFEAV